MLGLRAKFTGLVSACVLAAAFVVPAQAEMKISLQEEFPNEAEALVSATTALFEEIENTVSPKQKSPVISLQNLLKPVSNEPRSILETHGPLRHLTGYRISWYPIDRLLGSVDFMGTWDGNRNLVCGYVTWDLSDPMNPALEQISANYVDLSALSGKSDARVHSTLLEANCAFGAIDPNFTLFDVTG